MNKRGMINLKVKLLKGIKGQVWVETVIYLLIAFVMMGLVLAFAKPKIEEIRDKAIIEQSIEIIKNMDTLITEIGSPGNKRLIEIGIKKGTLTIDSEKDRIVFEINSRYLFTESGQSVMIGNINATTIATGKNNLITLKRDFSDNYNFTYKFEDNPKTLIKSSTPYRIFITNEGQELNKIKINFDME
jgi:hypothetical protein